MDAVDEQLIDRLPSRARAAGLQLGGEGGLLQALTKRLLEFALEGESPTTSADRHDPLGRDGGDSRNGHRAKTVLTDVGLWRSTSRGTGTAVSSRRSWPSGRSGCPGSTSCVAGQSGLQYAVPGGHGDARMDLLVVAGVLGTVA
jgi:hypothetical protein